MNKINAEEFLKEKEENIFSTGFNDIDESIQNVEKGSIITIGARPSMGKTSFAISVVNHLLEQDKKVFYFAPSMTSKMLTKRLVAIKLQIEPYKLNEKETLLGNAIEYFSKKELFINDNTNLTVEEIEEEIRKNLPDVVFIDYIQLLKMPKAPNFTDSINLAVQEIKRIAKETGVIFVILTQLSRAVEERCDKRPLLSDIRNSSLLEELSNVVLMLYRDEYYNLDAIETKGKAEIIFRKNDFGPLAIAMLKYSCGLFSNILPTLTF